MNVGCVGVNTTACPSGYTCVCRPCTKVPEVEFSITMAAADEGADLSTLTTAASFSALVSANATACGKLDTCARGKVGQLYTVVVRDNWFAIRDKLAVESVTNVEICFHGAASADANNCAWVSAEQELDASGNPSGNYVYTFTSSIPGNHLVEVMVNGKQVESSPVLVTTEAEQDRTVSILAAALGSVIGAMALAIVSKYQYDAYIAKRPVDFHAAFDRMLATGEIQPGDADAPKVPREIRRRDLELINRIGHGAFGTSTDAPSSSSSSSSFFFLFWGMCVVLKTS